MYYKLGQACITNWNSFVLLQIRKNFVTNWGSFIITNWGKCCYKLSQILQIRAIITNWDVTVSIYPFLMYQSTFVVPKFYLLNQVFADQECVVVERFQAMKFRNHRLCHCSLIIICVIDVCCFC